MPTSCIVLFKCTEAKRFFVLATSRTRTTVGVVNSLPNEKKKDHKNKRRNPAQKINYKEN